MVEQSEGPGVVVPLARGEVNDIEGELKRRPGDQVVALSLRNPDQEVFDLGQNLAPARNVQEQFLDPLLLEPIGKGGLRLMQTPDLAAAHHPVQDRCEQDWSPS